jgi:hypothetical protein
MSLASFLGPKARLIPAPGRGGRTDRGLKARHNRGAVALFGRAFLCVVLLFSANAHAHVGAPDVYVKASAGPYHLLVSVHPPATTPGAAGIDIRTEDPGVTVIGISLPDEPPQTLERFSSEQIFTGSVWVARPGAWRIVLHVSGAGGEAETSVPVPADSQAKPPPGAFVLLGLAAAVCLAGAAFLIRRRRLLLLVAVLPVCSVILIGATILAARKPANSTMQVTLLPNGRLQIALPGNTGDLVADHGHLMHLFAIRQPQMDVLLHLHPNPTGPARFETQLPSMAPGAFLLFADVVHRDGRTETLTAQAGLPVETGHALQGDDSLGVVPGLYRAEPAQAPGTTTTRLMDGYTLSLHLDNALHPRSGQLLRVTLRDPAGNPPPDMQLYLGMAAHAAVVKTDGSVFAHIHPGGTIPMAGMEMPSAPESDVSFPFGFPAAGDYRVFVQMKHGVTIETAAFDLLVP